MRVASIGKLGDLTGAFKQKGQWLLIGAPFERGICVALGLHFMRGEVFASFITFGLNHTDGDAIHKKHVVRRAGVGAVFAHGYTQAGTQIELLHVLNHPTRVNEFLVNQLPRFFFWSHGFP